MSDNSRIEWTDATWNPVVGCSRISVGCEHCYAERMAVRLEAMGKASYRGLTRNGRWAGEARCIPDALSLPLRWKKPRKVFVCSMGDLFHEDVPDEFIDRVFRVMQTAKQHTYQVLTKRPERMRHFLSERVSVPWGGFTFGKDCGQNIWCGTTVEDQQRADERIPHLLATPAAVRFVSVEPMCGPIVMPGLKRTADTLTIFGNSERRAAGAGGAIQWAPRLDWMICGGESGPGARPMHPDWVRSLRDQCVAADVPFLFKQWGEWAPDCLCGRRDPCRTTPRPGPGKMGCMFHCGKIAASRWLDGKIWDEYPAKGPTP